MNFKNILCFGILMILIGNSFFVSAVKDLNIEKEESFFSKISNFITGLIVWPGQPSRPDLPGDISDCIVSSWNCGDWGTCVNGLQNKSCTSNCETTKVESQSCTIACQVGQWSDTNSFRCLGDMRQKQQNRIVSPSGCNFSSQWINFSCTTGQVCSGNGECIVPISSCTSSNWISSNSSCNSSGKLIQTWTKQGTCSGGISKPTSELVSCEFGFKECSYAYSSWGSCNSSGQKRRDITLSSPEGCQEGNPVLVEDCLCTGSDWKNISLVPNECPSSGKQNRTWEKIGNCTGGVQKSLTEEVSCNYVTKCTDECFLGNTSCFEGGYKNCTVNSQTGCNVWGNLIPCLSSDYICVDGSCVINEALVSFNDTSIFNILNSSNSSFGGGGSGGLLVNGINLTIGTGFVELKEGSEKIIKLFTTDGSAKSFSDSQVKISKGLIQSRSFVLIKNENNDYPKKEVYLGIKSSSQGVCVKDQEVEDVSQVLSGCISITCPGSSGNYNCNVVSTNSNGKTVLVSGLNHSGVVEVLEQPVTTDSSTGGSSPGGNGDNGGGGGMTSIANNSSAVDSVSVEDNEIVESIENVTDSNNSVNWKVILYYIAGFLVLAILGLLIFLYIHRKKQNQEVIQANVVNNNELNHDVKSEQISVFENINNILDSGIISFKNNDIENSKKLYLDAKSLYEKNGNYNQDLENKFVELCNLLNGASQ